MTQNLPSTAVVRHQIALMDPATFDQMQRVGAMLALSPLFPEHLRKGDKNTAIANGVLVMNMAMRLQEDPLTVAQAIYFVGGKPGWSSSYLIAKANQHGVFNDVIDWEITGVGEKLAVTAFAFLAKTGKRVAVTCDMKMARAEGWTKNAKYMSMPEQMLRYRSATFLIRLYCPEVMIGVPAAIENELGMRDVTPDDAAFEAVRRNHAGTPHDADTGEVIDTTAKTATEAQAATQTAQATAVAPKAKETAREQPAAAQDEPQAPPRDVMESQCNSICADMADSGSPSAVLDFYGDQIAVLRRHAPDLAAVIDKTAAHMETGGDKDTAQGDLLGNR